MKFLHKIIPLTDWIRSYNGTWFKGDLMAGITVGVMLIPQGMAYAMIAGLPPEYGLYAALMPLVVYAFLGTSRQLAVGPVAMDSLFVGTAISAVALVGEDPQRYIGLAILLAFLVGLLQLLFGIIKLGFLVNFLARPVIVGFTTAAAFIIGANQLKYLFSIQIPRSNQLHVLFYDISQQLQESHVLTMVYGVCSIALMVFLKKWNRKLPAALILVAISICLVYFLKLDEAGLDLIGVIPSGLPAIQIPDLNWGDVKLLLPAAFALSLIAYMEAIAVAKAMEEQHEDHVVRPNQELIALGTTNLVGSIFSAFPVTGGFSRSAVNNEAGAKSGIAGIISAGIILLTLLFFTDLFYYLPTVILSAIILVAVSGLVDFKTPKELWRTDKKEFLMYAVTLLATLEIGIVQGIVIGVLLSILVLIYKVTVPHMALLGEIEEQGIYRNVKRFENAKQFDEIIIVRFDARLFYANMDYFKDRLLTYEENEERPIKFIVIDASGINSIDNSAIHMIRRINISYKKRGVNIFFAGLKGPVRDSFEQNRIYTQYGRSHFYDNIQETVAFIQNNFEEKEM